RKAPEGRQARRPPGRAANKIRASHQSEDGQSAGTHNPPIATRPSRRSHPVSDAAFENLRSPTVGAAQPKVSQPTPLVWPVVTNQQSSVRLFAGHTDTVPDIVGRIGTPPSLVIFTEGNHLMVVLVDDIVAHFPACANV